jgi:hypothetical protein
MCDIAAARSSPQRRAANGDPGGPPLAESGGVRRLALLAALAAACDPGATEILDPDGGGPADAAQAPGRDLAAAPGADLARAPGADLALAPRDLAAAGDLAAACINSAAPPSSGHHNAGEGCLGCHQGGGGPPLFTLAGTLYTKVSGGTAIAGATLEAIDANGATVRIVTSQNGNFYTGQPIAFPVTVRASACPNSAGMLSGVSDGNCNSCHDAAMRIHLP